MTTPTNDVDLAEYIDLIGKCAERLAALTIWVDDHGGLLPDDVNRGDVERLTYIANLLGNAKAYADLIDDLNQPRFEAAQP
jgi:hypothetical protein